MKTFDSDFKDFIDEIVEWDNEPEIQESYPDGLGQLLRESGSNPKRYATDFVQYLYESGFLTDFITQYKNSNLNI